nr:hypothetical protein [Pedobacter sp. ASV2]
MKKLMLIMLVFSIVSCKSNLSKKFDANNAAKDLEEIKTSGKVSAADYNLLLTKIMKGAIFSKEVNLNGLTYEEILNNAKAEAKQAEDKANAFLNQKFSEDEAARMKGLEENYAYITEKEWKVGCFSFFIGYKSKEDINKLKQMTYRQIFEQSGAFCKEKEYTE